jgi:hypothetical protein
MVAHNSKTSFEHGLEESIEDGWDPVWESFRTEMVPISKRNGSGKVGFFILLTHKDNPLDKPAPSSQERMMMTGRKEKRREGKAGIGSSE